MEKGGCFFSPLFALLSGKDFSDAREDEARIGEKWRDYRILQFFCAGNIKEKMIQ